MSPKRRKIFYSLIFIILLLLVPVVYFGFKYVRDTRSRADTIVPAKNVQVFNPVSNSFDIAWTTDIISSGKVMYGISQNNLPNEAQDIRGASYRGQSHIITVRGLDPEKTYYYKIISNTTESQVFNASTTKVVSTEPINIIGSAPTTSADKLVRAVLINKGDASSANSTTIGTAISSNGSWTLDAGNFRTIDGNKFNSFNNYLLQVEMIDSTGNVISRTVTANIGGTAVVALSAGKIDDPKRVAANSPTTSPTPSITPTDIPSVTPSPTDSLTPSALPTSTVSPSNPSNITVTNARIVNVYDGTFSVVWETNIPTDSSVKYTIDGQNSSEAFDKRASANQSLQLRTHYVDITDTTSSAGAVYQITLVNNGIEWSQALTFNKVAITEAPANDTVTLSFDTQGNNYLDQIFFASIPGKTSTIAAVPNTDGTSTIDLSQLRDVNDLKKKYNLQSTDKLTFQVSGATLSNKTELESSTVAELKANTVIPRTVLATSPSNPGSLPSTGLNIASPLYLLSGVLLTITTIIFIVVKRNKTFEEKVIKL